MEDRQIIVLKFEDSKIPEFKEVKGKEWIYYGDDNLYPEYLTKLFNKSAKHNAIINGKVTYIVGEGLYSKVDDAEADKMIFRANSAGESLNDIMKKCALDIEIFGGFYLNIIPNKLGGIADIYHMDYERVRSNEDGSMFFYKNDWKVSRDKPMEFKAFNPKDMTASSIFSYKEYRPGLRTYTLPNYIGAINYIEADMEVSKHTLTNAKTGFSPSKMINFFNGEPAPEMQRDIQKRMERKFTGADGSKMIIAFNNDPAKAPTIQDLGQSDLTKEDFQHVDALITQNLMAGHQITTPGLFGISEPGKLGMRNELKMAYEIFQNTYINHKQRAIEKVFNYLAKYKGVKTELYIRPCDPIGIEITDAMILAASPKSWILDKIGIDTEKYSDSTLGGIPVKAPKVNEQSPSQLVIDSINSLSPLVANKVLETMTADEIRALANLAPNANVKTQIEQTTPAPVEQMGTDNPAVNNVLTNLTGRQHQQINRIVRQYTQGKLSLSQASLMLKNGFGFTDDDVTAYLGLNDQKFNKEYTEEEVANILLEMGEQREMFHIIHSRQNKFSSDADMIAFEEAFYKKEQFGIAENVTDLEANILKLIQKNPNITTADIAIATNIEKAYAEEVLQKLTERGFITTSEVSGVGGSLVTRKLTDSLPSIVGKISKKLPEIMIRYSYEVKPGVGAPIIPGTRPFCRAMLSKDRLFSRPQIEALSAVLGYSLWDRKGGFWNKGKGKGISADCRHMWKTNIVVKK